MKKQAKPVEVIEEDTRFGFVYGAADVSRICHDRRGNVWICIMTNKEELDIRVTPGGKIKVSSYYELPYTD